MVASRDHVLQRGDELGLVPRVDVDRRTEPDGHEAASAWWARPAQLLEDWAAGRCKLYWPTYFTVLALADRTTVDELLATKIRTREPDAGELRRLPRSTFWQERA